MSWKRWALRTATVALVTMETASACTPKVIQAVEIGEGGASPIECVVGGASMVGGEGGAALWTDGGEGGAPAAGGDIDGCDAPGGAGGQGGYSAE